MWACLDWYCTCSWGSKSLEFICQNPIHFSYISLVHTYKKKKNISLVHMISSWNLSPFIWSKRNLSPFIVSGWICSTIKFSWIDYSFMAVNGLRSNQFAGLILEPVDILLQRVEQEAFTKVNIIVYNLFSVEVPTQGPWFWKIRVL